MIVSEQRHSKREPKKVLYAGYLPTFNLVGSHPQFHHLTNPPAGYEFIQSDSMTSVSTPRLVRGIVKLARLFGLAGPMVKLMLSTSRNGANLADIIQLMKARDIRSQLRIPQTAKLVFLPTWPYILNQVPWVVEIEDTTTLFAPFIRNGETRSIDVAKTPFYPVVKALLESDNCRGIICHVKSTAESIPLLFKNEQLRDKVIYIPLGVALPDSPTEEEKQQDEFIDLLFTNSWHQGATNFYLRGGLDLLEAFSILASKYPNIRLILRTQLPSDLDSRYLTMLMENWRIKVISQFLPFDEMKKLMSNTDIYVLPAARIHVVSILQAMSHSIPVVVSDGWGIEEYVRHEWNGIIVRGRYGKCSWIDRANGMLREDYSSLWQPNPMVIDGLVDSLSALIEDKALRKRIGQNGRKDVETKFSIDNWNRGLKEAFDQAL